MSAAKNSGITISYTAGGNGTITDLAGNALASVENDEFMIEPWFYEHPQTGESFTILLWLLLFIGSAVLAITLFKLYKNRFRDSIH